MNRHAWCVLASFMLTAAACNDHALTPLADMQVIANPAPARLTAVEVDVLWVIDDSNSMAEEQAELGARFGQFAEALAATGADFRIGVVSTSADERGIFRTGPGGQLDQCGAAVPGLEQCATLSVDQPFLRSVDYESGQEGHADQLIEDFQCLAAAGTCGQTQEAGLDAMRLALGEAAGAGQRDFLRDDAYLLVVFLSDEDDCSFSDADLGTDCVQARERGALHPVADYYDFLLRLKEGDRTRVMIAGLIGPQASPGADPAAATCASALNGTATGAFDGTRYRELLELAGSLGVEQSICQGDFSQALDSIGQVLRDNVGTRCLTVPPAMCTAEVDCELGSACLDPGEAGGSLFCAGFEVFVEVQAPDGGSYEQLISPGPVGDQQDQAAEYTLNWDAPACLYGVAVEFSPAARPEVGSTVRVAYPRLVDFVGAGRP